MCLFSKQGDPNASLLSTSGARPEDMAGLALVVQIYALETPYHIYAALSGILIRTFMAELCEKKDRNESYGGNRGWCKP